MMTISFTKAAELHFEDLHGSKNWKIHAIGHLVFHPGEKVRLTDQAIEESSTDAWGKKFLMPLKDVDLVVSEVSVDADGQYIRTTATHNTLLKVKNFRDARSITFAGGVFVEVEDQLWFVEMDDQAKTHPAFTATPPRRMNASVDRVAAYQAGYKTASDATNVMGDFGFIQDPDGDSGLYCVAWNTSADEEEIAGAKAVVASHLAVQSAASV